jgi:nucleotidyltransferase/DNA polymerase involved in DNA repair
MTRKSPPTSSYAACCCIPLFALRCEEARHPELTAQPCALLASDDLRRVWQVSPLARKAGVSAGLTISQAIGLCPALRLCEPDPVHYDQQFAQLLTALGTVSPVIEPAELGRVFVGMDGLEGLYGGPEGQVTALKEAVGRVAGWAGSDSDAPPGSRPRQVRLLGRRHSRTTRASRRRPSGRGKKFLAAAPSPCCRSIRHAPPAPTARTAIALPI